MGYDAWKICSAMVKAVGSAETCENGAQKKVTVRPIRLQMRASQYCAREESWIGLMPVRCFFAYSDLSQAAIVCAQNKFQSVLFEVFSKLISAFSAFIHLDPESSKVPFFIRFLHVCCAIWTFRQNSPPFRAINEILVYIISMTFRQ